MTTTSLCQAGTGLPQPAGDAAGYEHPMHGAVGLLGGILGFQTKQPAPGEGLQWGCLSCPFPMDVSEMVLEQKWVLPTGGESCAHQEGGWGSREKDGFCQKL